MADALDHFKDQQHNQRGLEPQHKQGECHNAGAQHQRETPAKAVTDIAGHKAAADTADGESGAQQAALGGGHAETVDDVQWKHCVRDAHGELTQDCVDQHAHKAAVPDA